MVQDLYSYVHDPSSRSKLQKSYTGDLLIGIVTARIPVKKALSKAVRHVKSVNLPSWKKLEIDWDEVFSGHVKGGNRISSGKSGDIFPDVMSPNEIKKAVQEAYKTAKILKSQAGRIKLRGTCEEKTIEMWLNKADQVLETAYPKGCGV